MKFNSDYGVYVCPHVFEDTKPILDVIRDHDGSWQFLCGDNNCVTQSSPRLVGVGHLVSRDETINQFTCLEPGTYAERINPESKWQFGNLNA